MAQKETLLHLDIDVDGAIKQAADFKKKIDELKAAQKELDTTTEEGRKTFVKQEAQLKVVKSQYRDKSKVLEALNETQGKFANVQTKINSLTKEEINSVQGARNSNKDLLKIRNELNLNTERGAKAAEQINKKLDENNKFIKENVSAYEKQKIGIGDYENAIKRALPGLAGIVDKTKEATEGLIAQKAALSASIAGTTGLTRASKLLKIALAGIGIGLLVTALASVATYLTSTQKGMDFVKKSTSALGAVMQVLKDRLLVVFEGFKLLFSGEFSEAADKFKNSVKDITTEIKEEAKAASELTGKLLDIEKAEARLQVEKANTRAEVERLKFAADDSNNSLQKRSESAAKAIEIEQALLNKSIALQQQKIEVLKEENALGTSTEEDLQRVRDAEIALSNLQQESTTKQIELNNKLNTFRNQQEAEFQQKKEQSIEKVIETLEFELEAYQLNNQSKLDLADELTTALLQKEMERLQTNKAMKEEILKEKLDAELLTELEHKIELKRIEIQHNNDLREINEQEKELKEEQRQEDLELEQERYEEDLELRLLRGENEFALNLERLERDKAAAVKYAKEEGKSVELVEAQFANKKSIIEAQRNLAQAEGVDATLNQIANSYRVLFGENKAINLALALSDTYLAAQKAYLSQMTLTPDSPIRAGIAAASATAFGLGNVAKIEGIQFQDGGMIDGNSHDNGGVPFTVQGKGGFEAEGGEYIINKKSTAAFLPLLERINSTYSTGFGSPNYFSSGGQVQQLANQTKFNYDLLANKIGSEVLKGIRSMPPGRISIEEINTGLGDFAEIVNGAEFE